MLTYVVIGVIFLWLLVLSFFLFRTRNHYHRLTQRTRKHSIDEILDGVLEKDIDILKKEIKKVIEQSEKHHQKVGLVRFNPFGRTGSDQSFVMALLDNEDSGVTINFIYTHEGIRVYAKVVKQGKGDGYELSEEEKRAISHASHR
jgi:thymidylate synthase ThyX